MALDARRETRSEHVNVHRVCSLEGVVFDVKRFAVHDGPGIRTTVFLKGCSLRCVWCHNPEAIDHTPEIMTRPERCIRCGTCLDVCPNGAHQVVVTGEHVYQRELCTRCGRCVEACYAGALEMVGKRVSVADVMAVLREDSAFYESSGGGVTLSGGEPLVQSDFIAALLRTCKAEGFHTAIDTCGHVAWRIFRKVLPYVDLVLCDLKHISPQRHRQYTGASNRLILNNLRRLSDKGIPVEIRMLIVPTINDSRGFIERSARFLASLDNITVVRLLPYHCLAGSKYRNLGRENTLPEIPLSDASPIQQIASWIEEYELNVLVSDQDLYRTEMIS